MSIIISNMIKLACNCRIFNCIINCYLQHMTSNLVIIQHFNFRKRCSFSVPSWLERKNSRAGLEKRNTFLQKFNIQKPLAFLLLFKLVMLFKCVLTTFWKMCRGVPFYFRIVFSLWIAMFISHNATVLARGSRKSAYNRL